MLNIGEPYIYENLSLPTFQGGRDKLSNYSDRVIIVIFIDIINGWEWLERFDAIYRDILNNPGVTKNDFQVMAVVYNYEDSGAEVIKGIEYEGPVTPAWVQARIIRHKLEDISFPVMANGSWISSMAYDYEYAFSRDKDPFFRGNTGNSFFAYIFSKENLVVDKWSKNCSSNGDPISFNHLVLKHRGYVITGISELDGAIADRSGRENAVRVKFYSELFYNTKAFVVERVKNILAPPKVSYTEPETGTRLSELKQVLVIFSKPVDENAAINPENYTVSGGAAGGTRVVSASYRDHDKIENTVTLELTGEFIDNPEDNSLVITINRTALKDASGVVIPQHENIIHYKVDLDRPSVRPLSDPINLTLGLNTKDGINTSIVSFSKPVTGALEPASYKFSTGGIAVTRVLNLVGEEYELTIHVQEGAPLNDGDTVQLTIDNKKVTGVSGNPLDQSVITYTVDGLSPSAIADSEGLNLILGPEMIEDKDLSTISFTKPVNGAQNPENYSFNIDGIVVTGVAYIGGNEYALAVDIEYILPVSDGDEIILELNSEKITDDVGNMLLGNTISYIVDTKRPAVIADTAGMNRILGSKTGKHGCSSIIGFTKPVSGATNLGYYTFSEPGMRVTAIEPLDNNEFRLIIHIDEDAPLSHGDDVILKLDEGEITDRVGNQLHGNIVEYQIDALCPEVITGYNESNLVLGTGTEHRYNNSVIGFTELVVGADDKENYTFSVEGINVIDVLDKGENQYELTIHIDDSVSLTHGQELALILEQDKVVNRVGNMLPENKVAYTIDSEPPTFIADPPDNSKIKELETIKISFSKSVVGADDWINYQMQGLLRGVEMAANSLHTYDETTCTATLKFTGMFHEGIVERPMEITVTGITDKAGNRLKKNTISYVVDTRRPNVHADNTYPNLHLGAKTEDGLNTTIISFSEPVTGADKLSNYTFSREGIRVTDSEDLGEGRYLLTMKTAQELALSHGESINLTISKSGVTDIAGNWLDRNSISYTLDADMPYIRVEPPRGSNMRTLNMIEITFSKDVAGVEQWLENYRVSKRVGSLEIDRDGAHYYDAPNRKAVLYLKGDPGSEADNEVFEIILSGITDKVGNIPADNTIQYSIDSRPPSLITGTGQVLGIKTEGGNNRVSIEFSKPVLGAEELRIYSFGKEGLRVTGATAVSDRKYELTIHIADGTEFVNEEEVILEIDREHVRDSVGNILDQNRLSFAIDAEPPVLLKVEPPEKTTISSFEEVTLYFSKDVTGTDNWREHYIISGASGKLGIDPGALPRYDELNRQISLRFTGSFDEDIEYREMQLTLKGIKDEAGNLIDETTVSYIIDTRRPGVTAESTYPNLSLGAKTADGINYSIISYTEDVLGAENPENYSFSREGLNVTGVEDLGASRYRLTIEMKKGVYYTHGDTVKLIVNREGIKDEAGNILDENTVTYTIDGMLPTIRVEPPNNSRLRTLDAISVYFSRDVLGAEKWLSNYSISQKVGSLAIDPNGAHEYEARTRKAVLKLKGDPGKNADNETLEFVLSGITDAVGNVLEESSICYSIDAKPPSLLPIENLVLGSKTEGGNNKVVVEFSKTVFGADEPAIYSFNRAGIRVTGVSGLSDKQYELNIHIDSRAALEDGDEVALEVKSERVKDDVGNLLLVNRLSFLVDARPPVVTSVLPEENTVLNHLDEVKIYFSKELTGAENWQDHYALKGAAGNIEIASGDVHEYDESTKRVTLKFSGTAGKTIEFGSMQLVIKGLKDESGNVIEKKTISYILDTKGPSVAAESVEIIDADMRNHVSRIRYSEAVLGAEKPENYSFSVEGLQVASIQQIDERDFELTIAIEEEAPVSKDDEIFLIAKKEGISDAAGNPLEENRISYRVEKIHSCDILLALECPMDMVPAKGNESRSVNDILRDTLDAFIHTWKANLEADDRVGVIYYKNYGSSGTGNSAAYEELKFLDDISPDEIEQIANTRVNHGGYSPVDSWVDVAVKTLKEKREPGRDQALLHLGGENPVSEEFAGSLNGGISLHAISSGNNRFLSQLPRQIRENLNERINSSSMWPGLEKELNSCLVEIFQGRGPQIISMRHGEIASSDALVEEPFILNSSAKSVTVYISWSGDAPLAYSIRRGDEIIYLNNVVEKLNYSIAVIAFKKDRENKISFRERAAYHKRKEFLSPIMRQGELTSYNDSRVEPGEDWTVEIERKFPDDISRPVPYHITVFADEWAVKYELECPEGMISAGDDIPLGVRIWEDGAPLEKLYSAEVRVKSPGESFGALVSKYKVSPKKIESAGDSGLSPVEQKLELMLQDSKALESITQTKEERISLESHKGDKGIYRGVCSEVRIPGIYELEYSIKGVGKRSGVFERTDYRTLVVKAEPDVESTVIKAKYHDYKNKQDELDIIITPLDRFDNLLGPGYAGSFEGNICGVIIKEAADNLDGSYTIKTLIEAKKDLRQKKALIKLFGNELFNDFPKKLLSKKKK
ncbi:MAG: hypothetical protein GY754_01305 [bacterium]|nr:hypothetical protein [bacterium]